MYLWSISARRLCAILSCRERFGGVMGGLYKLVAQYTKAHFRIRGSLKLLWRPQRLCLSNCRYTPVQTSDSSEASLTHGWSSLYIPLTNGYNSGNRLWSSFVLAQGIWETEQQLVSDGTVTRTEPGWCRPVSKGTNIVLTVHSSGYISVSENMILDNEMLLRLTILVLVIRRMRRRYY